MLSPESGEGAQVDHGTIEAAIKALIEDAYRKSDHLFYLARSQGIGTELGEMCWISPAIAQAFGVDPPTIAQVPPAIPGAPSAIRKSSSK